MARAEPATTPRPFIPPGTAPQPRATHLPSRFARSAVARSSLARLRSRPHCRSTRSPARATTDGQRLQERRPSRLVILPAVSLSRISPPRGGEYLHEVTAGSIRRSRRRSAARSRRETPRRGRSSRRPTPCP
ncbi:hypothetical protein BRC95_00335 [Halobacteriales archaeon QS_5_68_33]|nr:MAG: hypothetical protein BRC95_00335 [Halobacteriales archaeon QS_5_68_33]